jgi:hypothetical protein
MDYRPQANSYLSVFGIPEICCLKPLYYVLVTSLGDGYPFSEKTALLLTGVFEPDP